MDLNFSWTCYLVLNTAQVTHKPEILNVCNSMPLFIIRIPLQGYLEKSYGNIKGPKYS